MTAPNRSTDFVSELCLALVHRLEPERLFLILTAYFDESGTHDGSPITVMGGVMANVDQWKRFDRKFKKVKAKHRFNIFHTKKFKRRAGDFKNWTPRDCLNLIDDMAAVTQRGFTDAVVMTLNNDEYEADYRSGEKPRKLRLDTKYGLCFRECLYHFMRVGLSLRHKKRLPHIHVVLESGHKHTGDALRIFEEVKADFKGSDADMLETCTLADKDQSDPLMMADFISHLSYLRERKVLGGTAEPYRDEPVKKMNSVAHIRYKPGSLAAIKADMVRRVMANQKRTTRTAASLAEPRG